MEMDNFEEKENIQNNVNRVINELAYAIGDLVKLKIEEKYGKTYVNPDDIDFASIFNEVVNENITSKIFEQQETVIDFVKDYLNEFDNSYKEYPVQEEIIFDESKKQKSAEKLRKLVESKRKASESKKIIK